MILVIYIFENCDFFDFSLKRKGKIKKLFILIFSKSTAASPTLDVIWNDQRKNHVYTALLYIYRQ